MSKYRILFILWAAFIIGIFGISHSQTPIRIEPSNLEHDFNIIYSLRRLGNFEAALKHLDLLKAEHGETPPILSLYKTIYSEAKMYQELESVIRKQLGKRPNDPLLLAELGNVRFLRDDINGADSLWSLALAKSDKNQSVYIYVANYKLRYGDYEGAAETYLLGRERFGIPNLFSTELANIYESQRNYPAAVNEYLIMLATIPEKLPFVTPRILGLVEDSEDLDAIIDVVKNKIEENKDVGELYEILGDIYIKSGEMKLAFDTYRILGKGKDDDMQSLFKFAERCVDFKAYDTAIEAVDEYLFESERLILKDRALLLKGFALMQKGDNQLALDLLSNLRGTAKNLRIKSQAGYTMGDIYVRMGLRQEAISVWENTLELCRDTNLRSRIIYDMADSHIRLGSFDTAESLLTTIVNQGRMEKISQSSLFLLGELALFDGRYHEAQRRYMDIVRQHPGSDFANDAITRISVLMEVGIDTSGITADNSVLDLYADAMEARALEKYEDSATILLSDKIAGSPIGEQALYHAGIIYSEANFSEKAIEILKSYIEKFPEGFYVDRAYLTLGDQYIKNPETFEMGKDAYNTILESFQEGPVTELARERLRQLESQNRIG